jgi:hypothetical protein
MIDKEDISHLNLPNPGAVTVSFLGKDGIEVDEKEALVKIVDLSYDHENVSTKYYIMYGRGEIIDPYQADFVYSKNKISTMYKYRKVSDQCFKLYKKYLETKNRIHFTQARRLLMEN